MEEKISIIIPVYQAEKTLRPCVQSLLQQEEENFEVILVDDGSTDGSAQICNELAGAEKKVRCVHTKNHGAAAARNLGVAMASGELIGFVDSDDLVEPEYLSYLRDLRRQSSADIVACAHDEPVAEESDDPLRDVSSWRRLDEKKHAKEPKDGSSQLDYYPGKEGLLALLYQKGFMSVPWGMLSVRKLWDSVHFPEGTEAEDMGTIYRLFDKASSAAWGNKPLYHYIQRPESTMYATSGSRNKDYYMHSRRMVQRLSTRGSEMRMAAYSRHFSACCQILSETRWDVLGDDFTRRLRKDLRHMADTVRKDPRARKMNRGAAAMAKLSPAILHRILRLEYESRRKKLQES